MKHPRPFRTAQMTRAIAVVLAGFGAAGAFAQTQSDQADAPRAKDDNVRIGTVVITGKGDRLGAGQILNEDATKSRSTITRAATEKDRATGNAFQALALLPGVNTFNYDATGLFGGGLTVRGFGADQMGFTINGVPVNDSGNFAIYPQEYADQENLCTISVAQGSPDADSPHAGATGGNVGLTACDPEDARRVRVSQTFGGLNLSRTFIRVDSGRFADNRAKVFVSVSHSESDKWKGEGKAKRDHIDAAFRLDIDNDNTILGSVLYNRAIINSIYSVSLAQLNTNGYNYDYALKFNPRIAPAAGTAQTESAQSPVYWGIGLNPFENAIASLSGSFKLAKDTYLKVQPYFWYGFGNGGWSEQAIAESNGLLGGAVDLNGDGDTLDKVRVGRSSVTRTQRPGVTAEVNTVLGDHSLRFGLWYERAQHRQTQPIVQLNADGTPSDIWLRNCIERVTGECYEGRDWKTVSTAYQAYVTDNVNVLGDRGLLTLALRTPHVTRDVNSYASEGQTSVPTYQIKKDFNEVLPQVGLRYNLDKNSHVYFNIAKNFKAPPNYAYTGTYVRSVSGVVQPYVDIKAETSVMTDIGYRLQSSIGSLSATLFNSDYKNRQASAFDPNTNRNTYQNAGSTTNRGLELEAGSVPFWGGFTAYGSLTLQKSKVKDNLAVSATGTLATSGKQMTLTPESMIGAALQYATGPYYARLKLKYTGKQYATLMNDEEVPAYTVGDLDLGYKFADQGMVKNPTLRLNISNIGNAKYRNPSSGTVTNALAYGSVTASTVYYYLGAPRMVSLSLSADFQ